MNPLFVIVIGTAILLWSIIRWKLHPALALIFAAFITGILTSQEMLSSYAEYSGMSDEETTKFFQKNAGIRLAEAFGNTSAKVGILIALASIIGSSLMHSGGAEKIVRSLLRVMGYKNAGISFSISSFVLAIPVFFDTVFYLMIPLVKSISIRQAGKYSLFLMAVIAGGVMSHSLVPPTPGPLFVAKELNVDVGLMMIMGIVVGIITVIVGYLYAIYANKKWALPIRDTKDITRGELEKMAHRDNAQLPSLGLSILPIVLPLFFITANTFITMWMGADSVIPLWAKVFQTLGEANIAMAIACIPALYLLKIKNNQDFSHQIGESLHSAGMIILITSCGGAFGQMLAQTGIGALISSATSQYQSFIIPLAFSITALVRSAQGSATVAMVTTIGVMGGAMSASLSFHPVYIALAIGCGSKVFAWMNDSAFWVISNMSGMDVKETVQHFSYLMVVMAFTGLGVILFLAQVFPLI